MGSLSSSKFLLYFNSGIQSFSLERFEIEIRKLQTILQRISVLALNLELDKFSKKSF